MAGRQYIPLAERYAAALAELLPKDVREDLIRRKVSWREVERTFKRMGQIDHNVTVRTDSSARQKKWYNLNFLLSAEHKKKTAGDARRHAQQDRYERLRLTGTKRTESQQRRHKKIPSRKFATKEERRKWMQQRGLKQTS
jgi:hypothetical protein